jgi:hypothetical protein
LGSAHEPIVRFQQVNFMKLATVLALALSFPLTAQEKAFSGPQPGEAMPGFTVLAVNGPDVGREVDFMTRYADSPVLLIFIHQLDRNVAALITPCERFAQDRAAAGLKTLYVFLAPDKIEGERRMQAVTKSLQLKSQVAVSIDGNEGPGAYGLNKAVAITALVGSHGKVTANYAIVQSSSTDSPRIIEAVSKLVGGHVPTVAELELERTRQGRGGMQARGGMQGGASTAAQPDPPELQDMLRGLIQKSNSNHQVDQRIADLRNWAGAAPRQKALLINKLNIVIPLKYGTDYAQAQMQALRAELEK